MRRLLEVVHDLRIAVATRVYDTGCMQEPQVMIGRFDDGAGRALEIGERRDSLRQAQDDRQPVEMRKSLEYPD